MSLPSIEHQGPKNLVIQIIERFSEKEVFIIFCLFTVIGSSASLNAVTHFSDAMVFAMMVPNMIGLVVLAPSVLEELKRYKAAIKKV
jgi:Na+/alanine symporter